MNYKKIKLYHTMLPSSKKQLEDLEPKIFALYLTVIINIHIKGKDHYHNYPNSSSAHSKYNLKFKLTNIIPVFFHNLTNYDSPRKFS